MMGLFGKKDALQFDPVPKILMPGRQQVPFIELEGAMGRVDDETGKLEFVPRGPISIAVDKIGGYYDNTVILFGNKIRVMETQAQIALKIWEAQK